MYSGIKAYEVGKGSPPQTTRIRDEKPFTSKVQQTLDWKPFYDGKHIGRYHINWNRNNWIHYGKWLAAPRNAENFEGEKILIRKITSKTLIATYVHETSYCNTLLFVLKIKDTSYSYLTITGILNSSLIGWYFRKKFQISDDDTFPQIMIRDILEFPIPDLEKNQDQEISNYVKTIINLNNELANTKLQSKIEQFKTKLDFYEEKLNKIIFKVYGVSDPEKKIVEGDV
jgi:adenine-specific DNA-methyltransferase